MKDDSSTYFGDSKTLRTPAHRKMVIKFVRDQYPRARFQRIYDAATDGWGAQDFHRRSDKKGWTLTIVETTKDFIFGGFTTAEWESRWFFVHLKPCPHSFLFSVNEGSKYPMTRGGTDAIVCWSSYCAVFGNWELLISSDSNSNTGSWCRANFACYKLPAANGSRYPSMNGG